MNSLAIHFEWIFLLIVDDTNNCIRCLTWMFDFQEWMLMFWNYLTFFTNIKISANSTFISYTFNIVKITLVTSNIMMNDFLMDTFRIINWGVNLSCYNLWFNVTFNRWLFKNGLFNLTYENWKKLFKFLLNRKLTELTFWTTRYHLIKLRLFILLLMLNLLIRLRIFLRLDHLINNLNILF